MAVGNYTDEEELKPLTQDISTPGRSRTSLDSVTSASTTSIALERLNLSGEVADGSHTKLASEQNGFHDHVEDYDEEVNFLRKGHPRPIEKRARRILWAVGALGFGGWLLALVLFLSRQSYKHASNIPHDPAATVSRGSGKAVMRYI